MKNKTFLGVGITVAIFIAAVSVAIYFGNTKLQKGAFKIQPKTKINISTTFSLNCNTDTFQILYKSSTDSFNDFFNTLIATSIPDNCAYFFQGYSTIAEPHNVALFTCLENEVKTVDYGDKKVISCTKDTAEFSVFHKTEDPEIGIQIRGGSATFRSSGGKVVSKDSFDFVSIAKVHSSYKF